MTATPVSHDAEAWVIGAAMYDADARDLALRDLHEHDFARTPHRVLFATIKRMHEAGELVDEHTVWSQLQVDGTASKVAQRSHELLSLTERMPALANVAAYVGEVRQGALRRRVHSVGTQLAHAADNPESTPEDAVNAAEVAVCELRDALAGRKPQGTSAAIDELCDELLRPGPIDAVPFPLQSLTNLNGGQHPGDVVITGGVSGDGKTWWGLDCAEVAALANERTAFYSLEMPAKRIIARLAAMGGGLPLTQILKRTIDFAKLEPRLEEIRSWPLDIIDRGTIGSGEITVGRIGADLMRARMKGRPYRYVVVDHLHLLSLPDASRAGEYRIALNSALARFKNLAVEHGCTIHLLAQLRRQNERTIEEPRLADLKESSAIEQIGDYVLFVYRQRDENGRVLHAGKVIAAKVRDGENIGSVDVAFDRDTHRFRRPRVYVPMGAAS